MRCVFFFHALSIVTLSWYSVNVPLSELKRHWAIKVQLLLVLVRMFHGTKLL